MIYIDISAPFWGDLLNKDTTMNALWNIMVSINDCKTYAKGIKPQDFVLEDLQFYFGIKGNASQMAEQLEFIYIILNQKANEKS